MYNSYVQKVNTSYILKFGFKWSSLYYQANVIEAYAIMLFSQQSFTKKLYVRYFVIMVVKN